MNLLKGGYYFFLLLFYSSFVIAREESVSSVSVLGERLTGYSISAVFVSLLIIVFFVLLFLFYTKSLTHYKTLIFYLIIIPIVLSSLFLAGSTVYVNLISDTRGPVHRHADFEVWNCEEKLDLIDPRGLSNKVGSALFHEHNDNRVHVEGVVLDIATVGIDNFFQIIEGDLHENGFSFPTEEGMVNVRNGEFCNDKLGKVQVFLYQVINPKEEKKSGFIYSQKKLENFEDYVPSPYSLVPPGDCIIIEFVEEKEKTDHLCESYRTAKERGELIGR